jgi:hypothetical protein
MSTQTSVTGMYQAFPTCMLCSGKRLLSIPTWQCQRRGRPRLCVQSLLHRADPLQIVSENINKYPERRDNARRRQRAVEPTDEYAAWTRDRETAADCNTDSYGEENP